MHLLFVHPLFSHQLVSLRVRAWPSHATWKDSHTYTTAASRLLSWTLVLVPELRHAKWALVSLSTPPALSVYLEADSSQASLGLGILSLSSACVIAVPLHWAMCVVRFCFAVPEIERILLIELYPRPFLIFMLRQVLNCWVVWSGLELLSHLVFLVQSLFCLFLNFLLLVYIIDHIQS